MKKIIRHKNDGVVSEGEYKFKLFNVNYSYWELTRWRVTINGDPGNWHKIHGNEKNECAGFKLII